MSLIHTVVPGDLAAARLCFSWPWWSNSNLAPVACPSCLVTTDRVDRAHRELRASPRKPKVCNSYSIDIRLITHEATLYLEAGR